MVVHDVGCCMNEHFQTSSAMVGRDQQLGELEKTLDQACAGAGRVVFISGEAGSGKTRLLREFLQRNQRDDHGIILEGFCYDEDASVPYAPFIDAMRRFVRGAGVEIVRERAGVWVNELSKIMPELADDEPNQANIAEGQLQKHRLFEAIYQTIRPRDGGRCRIITLEDIHWSDQTSQELIRYLARAIDQDPILIICTYRSDELHRRHPLNQLLAHLNREHLLHEIRIPPLTRDDVARMAEVMLRCKPTHQLIEALYQRTEGNAFFVEETLKTQVDVSQEHMMNNGFSVPETIKANILSRIQHVHDTTLDVLNYAAVVGRRFGFETLRLLTAMSESELLQTLQCLINLRLIDEDDDGEHYRFHHELIREAMYDDLLARDRKIKHREVLGVLEQQTANNGESLLGLLAYHSSQARETNKAAYYAHQAGDQAMTMYAYSEAIKNYDTALDAVDSDDLATRADLAYKIAEAHTLEGNLRTSINYWLEAQQLYQRLGAVQQVGDTHRRLAWVMWQQGKRDVGYNHAQTAIHLLEQHPPSRELAMAYSVLSQLYMLDDNAESSIEYGEKSIALARELGDEPLMAHPLNNIGVSQVHIGKVDEGIHTLEISLSIAKNAGLVSDVLRAYHNLSGQFMRLGKTEQALTLFRDGFEYSKRTGWRLAGSLFRKLIWIELEIGDWHEAQVHLDTMRPQRAEEQPYEALAIQSMQIELWMRQGHVEQAIHLLEQITQSSSAIDNKYYYATLFTLSELYYLNQQPQKAKPLLDQALVSIPDIVCDYSLALGDTLIACIENNQHSQVHDLIAAIDLAHVEIHSIHEEIGWHSLRGLIAFQQERWHDAVGEFGLAVAKAHEIKFSFHEARLKRYLLLAQVRTGDMTIHAVLKELEAIREIFAALGAKIELARTDAVINQYQVNHAPPPNRRDELTPREQQVLALLARGMSNRAIAEELVISPKTAEIHVSNILSKLSLSSRAQVAAYVAEQAIGDGR